MIDRTIIARHVGHHIIYADQDEMVARLALDLLNCINYYTVTVHPKESGSNSVRLVSTIDPSMDLAQVVSMKGSIDRAFELRIKELQQEKKDA